MGCLKTIKYLEEPNNQQFRVRPATLSEDSLVLDGIVWQNVSSGPFVDITASICFKVLARGAETRDSSAEAILSPRRLGSRGIVSLCKNSLPRTHLVLIIASSKDQIS